MPVPNTFGTATSAIPLSQLDANFATPITIGNTAVQLGNTVTTLNNMTFANVTISSGNVTITNVAVTTANVSGTANISTLVVVGNATVGGNTTITGNITAANANVTTNLVLSGGTEYGVAYLNGSKALTTGSALVFDGTNLGLGVTPSTFTGLGAKVFESDGGATAYRGATSGVEQYTNTYFSGGFLYKASGYATRFTTATGAFTWYNAPSGTAGNTISFTQAMTLDASGNLLVGTTTGASSTSALMQLKKGGVQWDTGPNGSNGGFNVLKDGTTGVYLTSGATAWSGLSDETMKDIIEPIENASQKISTLRTVIGKYKTDEEGTRRAFLIAQDVKEVLPEAVNENENGKLGLQYTDVMPLLVAAIKEQQALITQLTARITALEGA